MENCFRDEKKKHLVTVRSRPPQAVRLPTVVPPDNSPPPLGMHSPYSVGPPPNRRLVARNAITFQIHSVPNTPTS
ncbi:hypothetical protein Goari_020328, partial [Gossypium aridum]|nr:hypothetical protein [Gossypium aridum]